MMLERPKSALASPWRHPVGGVGRPGDVKGAQEERQ